ncbi:MAG: NUDIX domain-containing protein [Patescibacteria group bacterium]
MLNKKEFKQLSSLLKKIKNPHEGLPQPVFDALLNVVPFFACELVIVGKKGILLTWREDKWWKGWHFPGGLLRYRESFDERIAKVAFNELGINIKKSKFLFLKNYDQGIRCHTISAVFLCKTDMTPKDGKFFEKMPKNIIEEHKELWKMVKKYY